MAAMEWVAMIPQLSHGARVLWMVYRAFDRSGMGCFWGDKRIMRLLAVDDPRTLRRYRKELKDAGLLETIRR